jgi:transcriptional antiterminator RfaH
MTWYVAYCGVRQEFRAAADLNANGIEAYVPREKHTRAHARIIDTVERVIFPRYLFFKLDEGQSFYTVRKTEGIEAIIGATTPQPIPYEWVHEIRERERAGQFDYSRKDIPTFANGEAVKIIGGPFAGQLATIMQAKPGARRVMVLLQALGRLKPSKVQVTADKLEKAA